MADMTDFDIKKGWFKNIEGGGLHSVMQDVFGNVKTKGDLFVSSYGIMEKVEVRIVSKSVLNVSVLNVAEIRSHSDDEILGSKRKLNEFLEKATGFNTKDRMKRAQRKAKEGKL